MKKFLLALVSLSIFSFYGVVHAEYIYNLNNIFHDNKLWYNNNACGGSGFGMVFCIVGDSTRYALLNTEGWYVQYDLQEPSGTIEGLISWGSMPIVESYTNIGEDPGSGLAVKGKLKVGSHYFCMYDGLSVYYQGYFTNKPAFLSYASTDENFSCPLTNSHGGNLINFNGLNPPSFSCSDGIQNQDETGVDIGGVCGYPTVNTEIQGLKCTTERLPIYSSVSWYSNFGNLGNNESGSGIVEGKLNLYSVSFTSNRLSYDNINYINAGLGSILPSDVLRYGTTQASNLDIDGRDASYLALRSKRDGAYMKYNVVNFYGTSQEGFYAWGGASVQTLDGKVIDQGNVYSSGGISTVLVKNGLNPEFLAVFYPVSGFSGMKVGYAPLGNKTSCSATFNQCQWTSYAGNLTCEGKTGVDGLSTGSCGLAGSGSVYGSGSCIPLTNEVGNIQQVTPLGKLTTKINPDGTTSIVVIPEGYNDWGGVFSCDINQDQAWYSIIGQYAMCPFTKIVPKVFTKIFNPLDSVRESVMQAQIDTSNTGSYVANFFLGTGSLSSNTLILTWKNNQLDKIGAGDGHWWNKIVNFLMSISYLAQAILVIGTIIWFIRGSREKDIP